MNNNARRQQLTWPLFIAHGWAVDIFLLSLFEQNERLAGAAHLQSSSLANHQFLISLRGCNWFELKKTWMNNSSLLMRTKSTRCTSFNPLECSTRAHWLSSNQLPPATKAHPLPSSGEWFGGLVLVWMVVGWLDTTCLNTNFFFNFYLTLWYLASR